MNRLAICLLSCDRPDYTKETLEALVRFNPREQDALWFHADDGSVSDRNVKLAEGFGFKNVYRREKGRRGGAGRALRHMWNYAARAGATHILHLENDWEIVRPIPEYWGNGTLRLYHDKKERGDGPRSRTGQHIAGTKEKIEWFPVDPCAPSAQDWIPGAKAGDYEFARNGASWGGPPSITKARLLVEASRGDPPLSIKQLTQKLKRIESLRVVENVVYHIGEKKTPGAWGD